VLTAAWHDFSAAPVACAWHDFSEALRFDRGRLPSIMAEARARAVCHVAAPIGPSVRRWHCYARTAGHSLADLEAELEWRLARNITERAERDANEARIWRLEQLIAQVAHQQPPEPPQLATAALLIVVAFILVAFALFLRL
jgi:hypothetical protein